MRDLDCLNGCCSTHLFCENPCKYKCSYFQIGVLPLVNQRDLVPVTELPGLTNVLLMDAVTAKLQVALDEAFTKAMVS